MASANRMKVPTELRRILLDFTVSCLLEKPSDIVEHGYHYFDRLRKCRGVKVQIKADDDGDSRESLVERIQMKKALANRRASVLAERYNPEEDSDSLTTPQIIIPKTDEERKKLLDIVQGVLLFRSLDKEDVSTIMDAMKTMSVAQDELVIQQGDLNADLFYVIQEGIYEATVTSEDGMKLVVHNYNNSGSFGELALLYNVPRAASVRAVTDGKLWTLDRDSFKRIVVKSAYQKRERYQRLIERVEFLKELKPYEKLDLADSLIAKYFTDGEVVIRQGDLSDGMYFIESGNVECVISHHEHGEVVVTTLEPGEYFGELSLLTHNRRALSAFSVGDSKLAFLDVVTFERLLGPCADILKRNLSTYETQMTIAVGSATSVYFKGSDNE